MDRLAFAVVTVPPLRFRAADILALANEFGLAMTRVLERDVFPGFSERTEHALLNHDWPGNVGELKNVVERAVWRTAQGVEPINTLEIYPLESPWRPGQKEEAGETVTTPGKHDAPSGFSERVAAFEKTILSETLERVRYNQTEAARLLNLSYHQLRRLTAKHNLRQ